MLEAPQSRACITAYFFFFALTIFALIVVFTLPDDGRGGALVDEIRTVAENKLRIIRPSEDSDGAPMPIVFFVPGWGAQVEGYLPHLRAFASAGFIVVGYEPSGTERSMQGSLDLTSDKAFRDTLRRADASVYRQAADLSAILDVFDQYGLPGPQVDPRAIGIYGHSFGGAVAMQAALQDRRFSAAGNIDGWLFAEAANKTIATPTILITDTASLPPRANRESSNPVRRHGAYLSARNAIWVARQRSRSDFDLVEIANTAHSAFTDGYSWRRPDLILGAWLGAYPDPRRLTLDGLERFFRRHLSQESVQNGLRAGDGS